MDSLSETNDSWFTALGQWILDSEFKLDGFPPKIFQQGINAHENLESSKSPNFLDFLSDEALDSVNNSYETIVFLNFMEHNRVEVL